MDNQTILNVVIAIIGTLVGLVLKANSDRVDKLETSCEKFRDSEEKLTERVHGVEKLVAGGYVTRVEHDRTTDLLFNEIKSMHKDTSSKFDAIMSKLETKLNRDDYKSNH